MTFLLVTFSWLFRGPDQLRKTVFGRFSWLFRGFFVAFPWLFRGPHFWQILRVLALEKSSGPHPQYGWDFPEEIPEKFRKDPGNALRAFPGISLESTAGMPQTL